MAAEPAQRDRPVAWAGTPSPHVEPLPARYLRQSPKTFFLVEDLHVYSVLFFQDHLADFAARCFLVKSGGSAECRCGNSYFRHEQRYPCGRARSTGSSSSSTASGTTRRAPGPRPGPRQPRCGDRRVDAALRLDRRHPQAVRRGGPSSRRANQPRLHRTAEALLAKLRHSAGASPSSNLANRSTAWRAAPGGRSPGTYAPSGQAPVWA
jgi:hypothetical protein